MQIKNRLTLCIPARHELYLAQTVQDILEKARGDLEIILVLDHYWPTIIPDDPRVTVVHWGGRRGMRAAINAAACIGSGEYFMKVDAHCLFAEGFDETLKADCDEHWVVVPRRYALDADAWSVKDKPAVDYEYLGYPAVDENHQLGIHGRVWGSRAVDRREHLLDENMSFQGSCWFMKMKYFRERVYPMDEEHYGMFIGEPQEIGLKVWLSDGMVMTNKKTWYAHLWKGQPYREKFKEQYGFGYSRVGLKERAKGNAYSLDFWFFNRWQERRHDLAWLVDKFWPVPSWPEEREQWTVLPTF